MKKADLGLRALLALMVGGSGVGDLVQAAPIVAVFEKLQVPTYYMGFFGVLKLLAVLGIFSPLVIGKEIFREGAQWGLVLYFVGAVVTHVLGGDAGNMGGGVLLLTLSLASMVLFQRNRAPA